MNACVQRSSWCPPLSRHAKVVRLLATLSTSSTCRAGSVEWGDFSKARLGLCSIPSFFSYCGGLSLVLPRPLKLAQTHRRRGANIFPPQWAGGRTSAHGIDIVSDDRVGFAELTWNIITRWRPRRQYTAFTEQFALHLALIIIALGEFVCILPGGILFQQTRCLAFCVFFSLYSLNTYISSVLPKVIVTISKVLAPNYSHLSPTIVTYINQNALRTSNHGSE